MKSPSKAIGPADLSALLALGQAVVVDVREADEFARRRIPEAVSKPLSSFDATPMPVVDDRTVVFVCRSGLRTTAHCERLLRTSGEAGRILTGGLDGWIAAGLPVVENAKAPLEIMRQVQIGAGGLVLTGLALGAGLHPAFYFLSAFVGAGLAVAGLTGFCGMARLLALAPWNRGTV